MHFTKIVSAKYLCDLFEKALVLKGYHIQLLPTFKILLSIFLIAIMIEFIQRLSCKQKILVASVTSLLIFGIIVAIVVGVVVSSGSSTTVISKFDFHPLTEHAAANLNICCPDFQAFFCAEVNSEVKIGHISHQLCS